MRLTLRVLTTLIPVLIAVTPGSAPAQPMGANHPTMRTISAPASPEPKAASDYCLYPKLVASSAGREYLRLRHKVVIKMGQEQAGLNIVCWGIGKPGSRHRPQPAKVKEGSSRFQNWLTPVKYMPAASSLTSNTTLGVPGGASTPTTNPGTSTLPSCTYIGESGGGSGAYTVMNSEGSGARGKYQIMPGTYAAYGGDGSWSPADQERVAKRLYQAEGTSPWDACG